MSCLVLILIFVLEELTHQVTYCCLGFSIIGIVLTGEDILNRDNNLSMTPLPYCDLTYICATFEVESIDFTLSKFNQSKKQTLRINSKIMTDS